MIAFGVISFLMGGDNFTTQAPNGTVNGDTFLGLEGNGWTNVLWVGGGALLLLAAPMHWGAKTMSIIVGAALLAAAVLAWADGSDALGIFAANGLTKLVWAIVGGVLLVIALLPRVGRKRHAVDDDEYDRRAGRDRDRAVVAGDGGAATDRDQEPLGARSRPEEDDRWMEGYRARDRELAEERERSGRFDREADRTTDRGAMSADQPTEEHRRS